MDLKDTVELMLSNDYKERFKGEYYQTKIRLEKLHKIIVKYDALTLDFNPTCSLELLKTQESNMEKYLYCLEVRAQLEEIEL